MRIRLSRNIRPYPFVSILNREGLQEIEQRLKKHIEGKVEWDCVQLENLEKEEREELVEKRNIVLMEVLQNYY